MRRAQILIPAALLFAALSGACTSGEGGSGDPASTAENSAEGTGEGTSVLEEVEVPSPEEAYQEAAGSITDENADAVLESLEAEIESDS